MYLQLIHLSFSSFTHCQKKSVLYGFFIFFVLLWSPYSTLEYTLFHSNNNQKELFLITKLKLLLLQNQVL